MAILSQAGSSCHTDPVMSPISRWGYADSGVAIQFEYSHNHSPATCSDHLRSSTSTPAQSSCGTSSSSVADSSEGNEGDDETSWDLIPYNIPWGTEYHNYRTGTLPGPEGDCIFLRSPTPLKNKRTTRACDKCRERKAKCSGERPACKRCLTRGYICQYDSSDPKPLRGPSLARQRQRDHPARLDRHFSSHSDAWSTASSSLSSDSAYLQPTKFEETDLHLFLDEFAYSLPLEESTKPLELQHQSLEECVGSPHVHISLYNSVFSQDSSSQQEYASPVEPISVSAYASSRAYLTPLSTSAHLPQPPFDADINTAHHLAYDCHRRCQEQQNDEAPSMSPLVHAPRPIKYIELVPVRSSAHPEAAAASVPTHLPQSQENYYEQSQDTLTPPHLGHYSGDNELEQFVSSAAYVELDDFDSYQAFEYAPQPMSRTYNPSFSSIQQDPYYQELQSYSRYVGPEVATTGITMSA